LCGGEKETQAIFSTREEIKYSARDSWDVAWKYQIGPSILARF